MPKTPGQLFVDQLFGGIQKGVEGLPRAVRQNRLDERQRQRDSFSQLLNVQRVTQAFEEQELRKARFQQSLLQTEGLQKASEIIGSAFNTQQIESAVGFTGPPSPESRFIGPLAQALGQGGVNPVSSLKVLEKLSPEEEPDIAGAIERVKAGGREGNDLALIARQKGGGSLLGKLIASPAALKGQVSGLNTNQSRVLTGQIDNAIRGEKKLTDSRVKTLKEAIGDKKLLRDKDSPPDQEEQEMIQRLQNLEDYLKFLNTGAAKDSVINEFLNTIDVIEERTK